jgi:aspartate-semialdehyde dehydrogenase
VKTGVQKIRKALKELDSGFRRNDMKKNQINFFTASGGMGGFELETQMKGKLYSVAVAGATGAVGLEMIKTLEQRKFPVGSIKLLASARSEGKELKFNGKPVKVAKLAADSFKGVQVALFSAGASRSLEFAPAAAASGAVVIDNSSAFRMDPEIPLVVPEVNAHAIAQYKKRGIIANPNCSTIQMVVALKPIHDVARIKRIVVSTYQAVSGTGLKAIDELLHQTRALLNAQAIQKSVYPHQIAFNCLPHIDVFLENGYTKEEMKMVNETRKIMEDPTIRVTATTVRVPVLHSHSESVNIETEKKLTPKQVKEILSKAPGVLVVDNPGLSEYPLAIHAAGRDETFVGRIREDESIPNGINMWIVSDNIRKGAALNAVQIAEILIEKYLS